MGADGRVAGRSSWRGHCGFDWQWLRSLYVSGRPGRVL